MTDLAATGALTRLALRRDRLLLALWLVVLTATVAASAVATADLYATTAERVAAARAINDSPAIIALYGPIVDVSSLGELAMTKMTVLYAVFVAVMAVLVVRRQLRTEEETGRAELLGGTAVGRGAPLAAALSEAGIAAVALVVLATLACLSGGLPTQGSVLFAASWGGIVLVFAAVSALACQLFPSTRTCAVAALGVVGATYVLRAVGDTGPTWLSWVSPFGWNTRLHAWADQPRWWVLALYPLAAGATVAAAAAIRSRRDLGAGLWPERPGPAHGSPRLADALALAWRTTSSTWWTWATAMAVMGLLFGAISPNVADLLTSPAARRMMARLGGEGAIQDTMVAAVLGVLAVVVTCFAVGVVVHGGRDEHDGRTEQVLATTVSRSATLRATAIVALVGATGLLAVTGVALALGFGGVAGSTDKLLRIAGAGLVHAPAVWCVVCLVLLVFAWRSRWTWAGWVVVTVFVTIGELGELLRLPGWVRWLSPYGHTPLLPAEGLAWTPLLWLTVVAAALATVAWWAYRTRDIG